MANCFLTDMINSRLIVREMRQVQNFQAQLTDVSFPIRLRCVKCSSDINYTEQNESEGIHGCFTCIF